MTTPIYPCLWFDNQAKEAADFYCSIFENSSITEDTPMVVNFELYGQKFMGLNGGPQFKFNPAVSFSVICETVPEIDGFWKHLSEGGKIMMPLDRYDWSERYGFVQDRFGLAWQLIKGNYSDVKQKITPYLLFVGKRYGKAEEAVKFYEKIFPNSSVEGILLNTDGDSQTEEKVKQFTLNEKVFMAMDSFGNHEFDFNEAVSFVVNCADQKEIDYYWDSLIADGGQESQCGWLKDKFGVSWQIIPAILGQLMGDPEKAPKVIDAFMQMKKFEIDKLLKA